MVGLAACCALQLAALAEELSERERMLMTIRNMTGFKEAAASAADEVQLQIMQAEREFMQAQLLASDDHSGRLALALERMRRKVAAARGVDPETIDYGLDAFEGEEGEDEEGLEEAVAPLRRGYDHVLAEKVLAIEEKVGLALDALRSKEEQISSQRAVLQTLTGLEDAVQVGVGRTGTCIWWGPGDGGGAGASLGRCGHGFAPNGTLHDSARGM